MIFIEKCNDVFISYRVEEYGKAELTDKLVYVLVDVGNKERVRKLLALHRKNTIEGKKVPEVVIIRAIEKKSASDITAEELKEFNQDDLDWNMDEFNSQFDELERSLADMKFDTDLTNEV